MLEKDTDIPNHPDWQAAYIGSDSYSDDYLVLLTLIDDPTKRSYGVLRVRDMPLGPSIEIPTDDPTRKESLLNKAYMASVTDEVVNEGAYLDFATGGELDSILALLNREAEETETRDITQGFYETFGIEHNQVYGSIQSSSRGTNHHSVTLQIAYGLPRADTSQATSLEKAVAFSQEIHQSLPHVQISPLPKTDYLNILNDSLQFLPRDRRL